MLCKFHEAHFYNHIFRNKRTSSSHAKRREELCDMIQEIYYDNRQIYGARKISTILRNNGEHVSEKVVLDLMRNMGLSSICEGARSTYLKNRKGMPNLVKQEFYTNAPNKIWLGDVTYYKSLYKKSYYICAILDLFSRRVVGYKISLRNNTQLIKSTFKQAYENRKPLDNLIFHNDRGSNYCSVSFRNYLTSLGVEHSFSKAHVPYDNAVIERFFRTLKDEELYRGEYRSENKFRKAIDDYILFYNTKRLHETLGDKTPEQVEADFFYNTANCKKLTNCT